MHICLISIQLNNLLYPQCAVHCTFTQTEKAMQRKNHARITFVASKQQHSQTTTNKQTDKCLHTFPSFHMRSKKKHATAISVIVTFDLEH